MPFQLQQAARGGGGEYKIRDQARREPRCVRRVKRERFYLAARRAVAVQLGRGASERPPANAPG